MRQVTHRRQCLALHNICLLGLVFCGAAFGATRFGEITVSGASPHMEGYTHGYLEHRVDLSNASGSRAHAVTIVIPASPHGGGQERIRRIERTVVVGPMSGMSVSLFQPSLSMMGNNSAKIYIDGRRAGIVNLASLGSSSSFYYGRETINLYVSRSVNTYNMEEAFKKQYEASSRHRRRHYPGGQSSHVYNKSESTVTGWSDNWLSYSCFDGVIVSSGDMRTMPGGVRAAIWQYVRCGGVLVLVGEYGVPAKLRARSNSAPSGMKSYMLGFGKIISRARSDVDELSYAEITYLHKAWEETAQPWKDDSGVNLAHQSFPVVKTMRVPVRGIFLVIFIAAIVIGPVNVIVLAKFNRRIWMLWTVPVISFMTCAVVFLYSLLSEGITPTVRMQGVTILDETSRNATTIGLAAFYCPLTPGGGLRYDYETEITPMVNRRSYGFGTDRSMDLTKEQHLESGWVSARVPAHFMIRKGEIRRERLQVSRAADGRMEVMNGLGCRVKSLWMADAAGAIYLANAIPAGAKVELTPHPRSFTAQGQDDALRDVYTAKNWVTSYHAFTNSPAKKLWPGTYIAVLEETPFIEDGLKAKSKKELDSVVFGIMPDDKGSWQ